MPPGDLPPLSFQQFQQFQLFQQFLQDQQFLFQQQQHDAAFATNASAPTLPVCHCLIQIFLNATMTFNFEISRAICKDGSAGGRLGSFTPASKTVNSLERACKGEGGKGILLGGAKSILMSPRTEKGSGGSGALFLGQRLFVTVRRRNTLSPKSGGGDCV